MSKKLQMLDRLGNRPPVENPSAGEVIGTHTHERSNERKKVSKKEEPERRRYSFDLNPDVHQELKVHCVRHGLKMYELVEELIEQYLKEWNE